MSMACIAWKIGLPFWSVISRTLVPSLSSITGCEVNVYLSSNAKT